jgi:hypothetical protein
MQSFVGKVIRKTIAGGSKSEHAAVVLQTGGRDYVLRMAGGNPFEDPHLARLVGKTIRCKGEIRDYALIVSELTEVGSRGK